MNPVFLIKQGATHVLESTFQILHLNEFMHIFEQRYEFLALWQITNNYCARMQRMLTVISSLQEMAGFKLILLRRWSNQRVDSWVT